MNVICPNSGLFSLPPVTDPAGRTSRSDPPDWTRLSKPLVLPEPYAVPKVAIDTDEETSSVSVSSGSRRLLSFRAAGPGKLEPWFQQVFFSAPPPHPSFFDPMQELSSNTPAHRASCLWGSVELCDTEPGTPREYGTDHPRLAAASRLWAMLLLYFETFPEAEGVQVLRTAINPLSLASVRWSFGLDLPSDWFTQHHRLAVTRAEFWASSPPNCPHLSPWVPLERPLSPTAPRKPAAGTVVYQRYIPALAKTLRYRLVDAGPAPGPPDTASGSALPFQGESCDASGSFGGDVPLFGMWQNSDRVNGGWRQRGPLREHYDFVRDCVLDPHRWGLIGTWQEDEDGDGDSNGNGNGNGNADSGKKQVEWGYVEIYWPAFSNIARWAQPSDVGLHALVGNEKFRGPGLVRTWMGAGVHLAFLLSPAAQRCLSEPRASNTKMVGYECLTGGQVERLIDLGHKRSALVVWHRDGFFQLCPMGPLAAHASRA